MRAVDLHRHLDGSLRPETLRALADEVGVQVPSSYRFRPAMGLTEALACFELTLSVLGREAAVERVAREMCEDAEAEGLEGLEIRFAPQLHGPPIEAVVDAALSGAAGRAGLILCGLYGEPPSVLEGLVDLAAARDGVLGIDIAGGPQTGHSFSLEDYAGPFGRARALGLGRTVHAGEGRPAEEIRVAIEVLHAQRVGHGTSLLDDERVLDLVLERGVTIEACPSSNVHTGIIPEVTAHPLRAWLGRGVKVAVCADNTLFSNTDVPREVASLGLSAEEADRVAAFSRAARF